MHNVIKCFCKSKEKIVTIPIHASFNQLNVCTGNGYLADIKCKFWQCARHLEGAADIAYTFKRAV